MHDFTLFLLKNWLPVGLASIVFFLIGLLMAKLIWGRWSQRLAFAVEENLNLASQWNALGSSQRDLFKKLRSRWQSDRDAWEGRLIEADSLIAQKDARIAQLTETLQGQGKAVPAEIELDAKLLEEIESLKGELRRVEEENRTLQAEVSAPVQPAALLAATPAAESSELENRIADLEKDLIDTHDELHQVRADYHKQIELVEVLESRLEGNSEPGGASKKLAQVSALLQLKSGDLLRAREEVKDLSHKNLQLVADLENASGRDDLKEELAKAAKSLQAAEIKITDRDSDIRRLRDEVAQKGEAITSLEGEIEAMEEKLGRVEEEERRRNLLQADLNDAVHEMYDVRSALNHRLDEISLLEARVDELEPEADGRKNALAELKDARHELSDVRLAYNEKVAELEQRAAEMEELEAIIEDRGAEVNDLSTELRQKRDELRLTKNSLAEKEGELEAFTVESGTFTEAINAKESFLEEQARRIADLESALTERYAELNTARSELDDQAKTATLHETRADQLQAELTRKEEVFRASDARVASAEEAVEEARSQITDLTDRLNATESTVQELQESLQAVSREKDEAIRELEKATRRVAELEEATSEREDHIRSIEQEWRDGQRDADSLERQISRLNLEMEEAKEYRQHTQVTIEELEEALKASDDRVLSLSKEIEKKDAELSEVKTDLESLQHGLSVRDSEITNAKSDADRMKLDLIARERTLRADVSGTGPDKALEAEVERLTSELAEKEEEIQRFANQRGGSATEIQDLKRKIEKRGEAIRELQGEVSNIMMQRTARENEVSSLKDKLRKVEEELLKARELTANASASAMATPPSVRDLEAALQESLESETQKSEGRSLDQLASPLSRPREATTEAHHSQSEQGEDDANQIFFDETSVGLNESEVRKIDEFAQQVRRSSKVMVTVIGFAGAEGTADLTESLSARRADAVRERLLERGVPQSRIEVKGSGQDRKFQNWRARRVELISSPIAVAETVN